MITALLDHGGQLDVAGAAGETPLHVALIHGHYHATATLLERGADLNKPIPETADSEEMRPIQIAVKIGSKPLCSLLLRRGANPQNLNFSAAPAPDEIASFVQNEEWKEDDWDPELLADSESDARVEDVREFQYPECPEVDVSARYTDPEYVKRIM
jgi:ankyrin repeat protein